MVLYIILFLISFISSPEWVRSLSILTHADWSYQSLATMKEFLAYPVIWGGASALGGVNITNSFYPFQLVYGVLAHFNFSYGLAERMVFMWPILLLCPIGSYLLVKKNISSPAAAIVGSFVYTYNTYFSLIKTGHLTLMVAYSLSPLVIYFFQLTLEKKKINLAIFTGILAFITSYYEFRGFYILCIILFIYYLYRLLVVEKFNRFVDSFRITFFAGLPIILAFSLNAYWILALSKSGSLTTNAFFERTLFGNEFLNILYAITLFHPFWTGGRPAEFVVQPIPIYFWLIPIFAFMGLYLNRKNKNVLFFGLISLLGIFLTKQVAQPFSVVYPFLYKYLPGFNAFREASKFYFLIALGYSVLIGGFVDWIHKNWKKKGLQTYGKYLLTGAIALIFLWNTKPFITGEIATLFVPRHVPHDYEKLKDFIVGQDEYFRTLWIPTYSRFSIYTNNHPEISTVDIISTGWNTYIKNKRNDKVTEAELMQDVLSDTYSNNLLDLSSVKYVIIPLEDKANEDNFFIYYGKPRKYYIDSLDRLSYLHKIAIGTKEILVYENSNFRPHVYTTKNKEQSSKNISYQEIDYKFINPTQYKLRLENITSPVYLNFAESYHPKWKVRVGELNWFSALTNKNYFVTENNHFKNDAGLNSYRLDPLEVCRDNGGCTRTADGSYDMDLTLYFQPQSYVYFGSIISAGTLILVVGYLMVSLIRRK